MNAPTVESYSFGRIAIGGRTYRSDLIILPDRVLEGWWRQQGHTLRPEDLAAVFEAAPDTLVVGLGAHSRMRLATDTRRAIEAAGIQLVALPTDQACETYNRLSASESAAVAAALHLTC